MDAHTVLCRARNLLDREGWAQAGTRCSPEADGRSCTFLLLIDAQVELGGRWYEAREAEEVLLDLLGLSEIGEGYLWNDAPGRTKAEVLDLFDRAIASTAPHPADPFVGERMAEGAVV